MFIRPLFVISIIGGLVAACGEMPSTPTSKALGQQCAANADCQSGFCRALVELPEVGVCSEPPINNGGGTIGANTPGGNAGGGALGGKCQAHGDCAGDVCLTALPEGYCSGKCSATVGCGQGGVCVQLQDQQTICLQACNGNANCRPDHFCGALEGSTFSACYPRCRMDADCSSGLSCNIQSGQCQSSPPPTQPPLASTTVDVQDLGVLQVGPQGSQVLTVQVPQGALSLTLIANNPNGGNTVIYRVEDPMGRVPVDSQNPQSPIESLPLAGMGIVQIPNSLRADLHAGSYSFAVASMEHAQAHILAVIKLGQPQTTGTLNLNCFFVGIPGLAANNASTHPQFQATLARLKSVYRKAGVNIGSAQYFDIVGNQAAEFTVIDSVDGANSELVRMFELSANAPSRALNLFFVQEIKGADDGFTILGVAGGIPGAGPLNGTKASGVAVTIANFSPGADVIGHTVAHESGHYLGLRHLSESNGSAHDPLTDTAECSSVRDANGDGLVTADECAGLGAANLMFWEATPNSASQISAHQSYVILRNPLIQ